MHPAPAQLGGLVDFVASEPVLAGIMLVIVVFVVGAYLFLRYTVLSMREGYDDAYRK